MEALERDYEAGDSLLRSKSYGSAMQLYERLIGEHPTDPRAFRGASEALLAAVTEDGAAEDAGVDLQRLVTALIIQADCPRSPPFLHERIANYLGVTTTDHGPKIAAAVGPALRLLIDRAEPHQNVVLLLLLMRESLGDWISQDRISAYHFQWLGQFDLPELSILYSNMFDPVHYRHNRADIIALAAGRAGKTPALEQLSPVHVLLLEWVAGSGLISGEGGLARYLAARSGIDARSATAKAAALSLIVRHREPPLTGSQASDPAAAAWTSWDVGADLLEFAASTAERRRRLQGECTGSAAAGGRLVARLFQNRRWQLLQAARHLAMNRTPLLGRLRRRPRVAICVSGQLRGYERAFRTWQRTLLCAVEHDIFVDSWCTIGRSGAEPFRAYLPFVGDRFVREYREVGMRSGFDEIKARYPALFAGLAASGRVSAPEIASFYGSAHVTLDDEQQAPFKTWSNQQKMHAKIASCFKTALAAGGDYDFVIRIRPDKPIRTLAFGWSDLRKLCRSSPTIFTDLAGGVHYGNLMVGDQFAIGTPEAMRVYADTWTTYPELARFGLMRCEPGFQGHCSLAQVCWLHGIEVRRIPIAFGALQEAEPLGACTILEHLSRDAAGRMDAVDAGLIAAITRDVADSGA
jgi:hypothetical protein